MHASHRSSRSAHVLAAQSVVESLERRVFLTAAPVGQWSLEENAGQTTADTSGFADTASLVNSPTWVSGRVGNALSFNGVNQSVSAPDKPQLELSGDMSLAMWINRTADGSDYVRLIGKGGNAVSGPRNYGIWLEPGASPRILFQQYDSNGNSVINLYSNTHFSLGQWTHVAITISGNAVTIYINGVADATGTRTGTPATSADPLTLAYAGYYGAFNGKIDEVNVYDRAISATEVSQLYNVAAAVPVGQWHLDESSGTTASDSSAAHNNGIVSGATFVAGKVGNALSFNGTNQSVSINDSSALQFAGDMTLACWIKLGAAPTDWTRLVGKGGNSGGGDRNYGLWLAPGSNPHLLFQQYTSDGAVVVNLNSSTTIATGQWYHLAVTVSGSSVTLYVNGVADASATRSGLPATSVAPLTFGYAGYYGAYNGLLDEVNLYNQALSVSQISQLANPSGSTASPSYLTANVSGTTVNLSWVNGTTYSTVKVQRKSGTGSYATIATLSGSPTSYSDASLAAGGYTYQVIGTASGVDSMPSNSDTATIAGANGIIGQWKFDETSGATANDTSGLGDNGTLVNSPSHVAGKVNNALSFNGSNQYVDLGNPAALNFAGAITLAAWIKPTSLGGFQSIIDHGYTTNPNAEVFLRINAGKYEAGAWDNSNPPLVSVAADPADANTWVHLAVVYDGTRWTLYKNGASIGTATTTVGAVTVGNSWAIGSLGAAAGRFFSGAIDEVGIYNRALSAGEVQQLANPGGVLTAPSALSATSNIMAIGLQWTDTCPGVETGFRIERQVGSGSFATLATLAQGVTTYSDTSVNTSNTYTYRVFALQSGYPDSPASNVAGPVTPQAAVTIPAAPSNLAASAASSSQINLTWVDNSSNETGFKVERSTDQNTWVLVATTAANTTGCSDSGLSPTTTYYYRVRATNSTGDSTNSNIASATTPSASGAAPASPSRLQATGVSTTQTNLTWSDNSSNETGFKIDRATDIGFTQGLTTFNAAANATSYSDTTVSAGQAYYYRVRATNSGVDSPNSSVFSVQAATALSVQNATFSADGTSPTPDTAPSGWSVTIQKLGGAPGSYNYGVITVSSTQYPGLGTSEQVAYMNNGTAGSLSQVISGATLQPGTLTLSVDVGRRADIPSVPFLGYDIRLYAGSQLLSPISYANPTPALGQFVTASATYAVNADNWLIGSPLTIAIMTYDTGNSTGQDNWTNVRLSRGAFGESLMTTAATTPAAPTNLASRSISSTQILLNWINGDNNQTGFQIDRAINSAFTQNLTTFTAAANATSYCDTAVTAGISYYYRVRATNAGIASANCNTTGPVSALATTRVPVFILAGQSNMVGYGSNYNDLSQAMRAAQSNVLYYQLQGSGQYQWQNLTPPTEGANTVASSAGGFGPEVTLGKDLSSYLGQVALVKSAKSGTNLFDNWSPSGDPVNQCYGQMKTQVNAALTALQTMGLTGYVAGFFWMQGEGDSLPGTPSDAYAANLANFISYVRQDFNDSNLPFIMGQVSPQPGGGGYQFPGAAIVESAQYASGLLANTSTVPTYDLPTFGDNLHFNSGAEITLGDRMAQAYEQLTGITQFGLANQAFYNLGESDSGQHLNGSAGAATTVNSVTGTGLTKIGSPVYTTSVANSTHNLLGDSVAMTFHRNSGDGYTGTAAATTATNNWGIEAWVNPSTVDGNLEVIACNGDPYHNGFGIVRNGSNIQGEIGGQGYVGSAAVSVGVWTHIAFVCSYGVATLYVNGVACGSTSTMTVAAPSSGFSIGASAFNGANGLLNFDGSIDEVRVFTFAPGSFSTNQLLYC